MKKYWQFVIILFLVVLLTLKANLFADSQASGNNNNNCTNNYCTVKLGDIPILHIKDKYQVKEQLFTFEKRRNLIQDKLIGFADSGLPVKTITFDKASGIIKINDYLSVILMTDDKIVSPDNIEMKNIDQQEVRLTLDNAITAYRNNKDNNYMTLPDLITLATSIHDKINTYWNIYMAGLVIFVGWLIEKKIPDDPNWKAIFIDWKAFIIIAFICLVTINGFSIFSGYCFLGNVIKEVHYRVNNYPSSFTTEEIKNALKSLSFQVKDFILFELVVYGLINLALFLFLCFQPLRKDNH
ncbi:MAG: hypothetical protein ACK5ZL_01205 [bacterium]|jgi:hypothetical protein